MDVKYEYDTRQGMRRKDDDGANGCLAAFALFLVIGLLLGIITAFAGQDEAHHGFHELHEDVRWQHDQGLCGHRS